LRASERVVGLGDLEVGARIVQLLRRHHLLLAQLRGAIEVRLGLFDLRLGAVRRGAEFAVVELDQRGAGSHRLAFGERQGFHLGVQLADHFDGLERFETPERVELVAHHL
jgi:hypothetical protein